MYFKGVNRGVSFTKAGRYAVGLVFLLGLFAMGSGYNGLYLSLSLGLSLLVISGLLSEKVMKNCGAEAIAPAMVDAGTPFSLVLKVKNESKNFSAYGLEYAVGMEDTPVKGNLKPKQTVAIGNQLSLRPDHREEVQAWCSGLPRGLHRKFRVAQRTGYPFGLLIKFRLDEVTTNVQILPKFDDGLADRLREDLRGKVSRSESDAEFYSHRPYVAGDSLRLIDWKKSSRSSTELVIKLYRSESDINQILLVVNRQELLRVESLEIYEQWLSAIRTACQVIEEFSRVPELTFDGSTAFIGYNQCVQALVEAPTFKNREKFRGAGKVGVSRDAKKHSLSIGPSAFEWDMGGSK